MWLTNWQTDNYPSPAWQVQFTRSDEIESVNKTIIHDIWHCIYYYYVLAIGHDKEFFGCALYYYIYILLEEGFNLSAYFVLLLRTIYVNDHTVWSMNHIHCNSWKCGNIQFPSISKTYEWNTYYESSVCLPLVHFWWDLSRLLHYSKVLFVTIPVFVL